MAKKKQSLQVNAFTLFFVLLSLVLTLYVVGDRVIYRSDAKSVADGGRDLEGGGVVGINSWWNAGISCGSYYIGAENGITEVDFYLHDAIHPGEPIRHEKLRAEGPLTKPDIQFVPWEKEGALSEYVIARYVGVHYPYDGPITEIEESYYMDCRN